MADRIGKTVSQRQLRVGEMIKQSLGMIFVKNEAKVPNLETNTITVTEVKMSQDLKIAKAYVLPLGGKDTEEVIKKLREYSFLIRKVLSKKVIMKYLPKILFAKDDSFEYAEKIENLIKQTNKYEKQRMSKKVQELAMHDNDTGSSEVQIALLTEKIEALSNHIKQFKKDKHSSVGLLRAVNRRKKLLEYLKKNKMDSYKNVLSKLNLRK